MDLEVAIPELPGLVARYAASAPIVAEEIKRGHDRAGLAVQREAQLRVRVKTGHLRRSVTFATTMSGLSAETRIGTNVPYGRYLDEGTRAHGPVHAKVLVFVVNGKTVFARRVRGITGDKWLSGALQAIAGGVRAELAQIPTRIIQRIAGKG